MLAQKNYPVNFRLVMILLALALLFAPAPALANSITVNTTADNSTSGERKCCRCEA